ncbi:hypothetical protein [Pseudoxanthomonas sp. Root630]|uniref:hypothetical protein n=1 Tax=Pseudoxanthomonas sp. Root630 TaxID=1736574 RepID=UPI00070318B7|nr:hypothetical protein [Pseudoxanthomonas sp. Root630]KRA46509.1 hypothetical protein ASD72_04715 [Pseudoxanthomonas sp. Root630]
MKRLVLALTIILIACGMTKSPKSFDPVPSASHFVLEADVMMANKVSSGLAKGSYQAVFQSKDHIYYLGEPGALLMPNGTRVNGGIALPKHALAPPCHLFIQIGDDSERARDMRLGALVVALARLEKGRIREFKEDPACIGFMTRIAVVND